MAPACTAAASRPRSSCRRPRCCARCGGAAEFGVQTAGARRSTWPSRRCASSRWSTGSTGGLESLLKGRKVTVVPGTGTLAPDGRTLRVSDGTELRGRNVRDRDRIVAARAADRGLRVRRRPRALLGPRARARRGAGARRGRSAAGRSAASSRRSSSTSAPRSPCSRCCRRSSPASTSRSRRRWSRAFAKRGDQGRGRRRRSSGLERRRFRTRADVRRTRTASRSSSSTAWS